LEDNGPGHGFPLSTVLLAIASKSTEIGRGGTIKMKDGMRPTKWWLYRQFWTNFVGEIIKKRSLQKRTYRYLGKEIPTL